MTDTWTPSEDLLVDAEQAYKHDSATALDRLEALGTLFFCRQEPEVPRQLLQDSYEQMSELAREIDEAAGVLQRWGVDCDLGHTITDGAFTEVLAALVTRDRAELVIEAVRRGGSMPTIDLESSVLSWDRLMGPEAAGPRSPLHHLPDYRWRTYWPAPEHCHRLWWWTMGAGG